MAQDKILHQRHRALKKPRHLSLKVTIRAPETAVAKLRSFATEPEYPGSSMAGQSEGSVRSRAKLRDRHKMVWHIAARNHNIIDSRMTLLPSSSFKLPFGSPAPAWIALSSGTFTGPEHYQLPAASPPRGWQTSFRDQRPPGRFFFGPSAIGADEPFVHPLSLTLVPGSRCVSGTLRKTAHENPYTYGSFNGRCSVFRNGPGSGTERFGGRGLQSHRAHRPERALAVR